MNGEYEPVEQQIVAPQSMWPVLAASVVGLSIAGALVGYILYLRPGVDPLALIGGIGGVATLVTTQVIAIIKNSQHDEQSRQIGAANRAGQERVYRKVDGMTHELIAARAGQERAEGQIEGAAVADARTAAKEMTAALAQSIPAATIAAATQTTPTGGIIDRRADKEVPK